MSGSASPSNTTGLVLGQTGQLARALANAMPGTGVDLVFAGRTRADLGDTEQVLAVLREIRPAFVINAAAYTAVDNAENDEARALAINGIAPGIIAEYCASAGISLIHISTDYVFDGASDQPYQTDDICNPKSAYGRSKLAGENAVREACDRHFILRTSWLYSENGTNFLRTMLRLGAERDHLSVVDDQIGAPTYVGDLANAVLSIVDIIRSKPDTAPYGTYHVTNAGSASWYGFAAAIFASRAAEGLVVPELRAITTAEYPTPAARPARSVLDMSTTRSNLGIEMPDWRDGLSRCLAKLANAATTDTQVQDPQLTDRDPS